MLNGVADSRESSSLSELSHPTHNIMCYKINVIHTTRLNSKAKSKKKEKNTEFIAQRQIPTYVITVPKRHGRTDGRTDRRHAISQPRYV